MLAESRESRGGIETKPYSAIDKASLSPDLGVQPVWFPFTVVGTQLESL